MLMPNASSSSVSGSARAKRPETITSAAQLESAWRALEGGKRDQPGSVHVTEIGFSELLLRPLTRDEFPSTLSRVFSAQPVMSSLCKLDLSYNNLHDSFWMREWAAVPATGLWTTLTSVNFANNMYVLLTRVHDPLAGSSVVVAEVPTHPQVHFGLASVDGRAAEPMPQAVGPRSVPQPARSTASFYECSADDRVW